MPSTPEIPGTPIPITGLPQVTRPDIRSPSQALPAASNGGTGFTYDATLLAAKATVDGQEVLAPKRTGNGIQAQVVPRSATLASLLATNMPAGELAYPTDAIGVVQGTGTAVSRYIAPGQPWVIDMSVTTGWTFAGSVATYAGIPVGVRDIIIGSSTGTYAAAFTGKNLTMDFSAPLPRVYAVTVTTLIPADKFPGTFPDLNLGDGANARFAGALYPDATLPANVFPVLFTGSTLPAYWDKDLVLPATLL